MPQLLQWITQLAADNPAAREAAARKLYQAGAALGDSATAGWRADPEFAVLLSGPLNVGIAVNPATFESIRAAQGRPRLAVVPPDQDAAEFELHLSGSGCLDILTSHSPGKGGAIDRFLQKFGAGIQQVEYPVTNVDRATEILRARFALEPIYAATRPGADGTRVNFFLAATLDGRKVLIELVE